MSPLICTSTLAAVCEAHSPTYLPRQPATDVMHTLVLGLRPLCAWRCYIAVRGYHGRSGCAVMCPVYIRDCNVDASISVHSLATHAALRLH